MSELEAYKQLTQAAEFDDKFQITLAQIDEFERFLQTMKIKVEKKKILISREDLEPRTVYLNV